MKLHHGGSHSLSNKIQAAETSYADLVFNLKQLNHVIEQLRSNNPEHPDSRLLKEISIDVLVQLKNSLGDLHLAAKLLNHHP